MGKKYLRFQKQRQMRNMRLLSGIGCLALLLGAATLSRGDEEVVIPPDELPSPEMQTAPLFPQEDPAEYSQPMFLIGREFERAAIADESEQRYHDRFLEQQIAAPRPDVSYVYPRLTGLTFASPLGIGGMSFNAPNVAARGDFFTDSTKMAEPDSGFKPKNIVVAGQPFFGTGPRSYTAATGTLVQLDSVLPNALSGGRFYYENDFMGVSKNNGGQYRLRHAYAQLSNFVLGSTFTNFSDVDAIPETVDFVGPNAQMYNLNRPQVAVFFTLSQTPVSRSYVAFSVEQPNPDLALDAAYTVVSRMPDLVAKYRWGNKSLGHFQLASVFRNTGVEKADSSFDQSAFGWGINATSEFSPFSADGNLAGDIVYLAGAVGEGIGRYNIDLSGGGYDAALDAQGNVRSLGMSSFYCGYTHYWSPRTRSTITDSQVHVDSLASQGALAYQDGSYLAANTIVQLTGGPFASNSNVFLGIEYLYGSKETFGGASGHDHRIQFSVVVRDKAKLFN